MTLDITALARLLALALGTCALLSVSACREPAFCLDCSTRDAASSTLESDSGFGNADATLADGGVASQHRDGGDTKPPCFPSDTGEQCNQLDDDCDGEIDEDFDLATNLLNCGACDHPCQADNAETECVAGECQLKTCLLGFADLDGTPGCEYRCPVFPAEAEDCNGIDDDCDGKVDEELHAPPAVLCRSTPGTPCADVHPSCEHRNGQTTWYCDYPQGVEFDPLLPNGIASEETKCDGIDGDCDGAIDDAWPQVGHECDDGAVGACRDVGVMRCDPNHDGALLCDLSVAPDPVPNAGPDAVELCNGVDDNCDGIVDNSAPTDDKRIRDDMVHVVHGGKDFWIYRYEASRPDATARDQGIASARACSKPDAQPWTLVRFDAAVSACAAANLRLCNATEWLTACQGGVAQTYPYGASYAQDACEGADRAASQSTSTLPSGALSSCASPDGVLDLSGNVKEWTDDMRGMTSPGNVPIYVVRGGSYQSPELGLSCTTELSQATADTTLVSLGFRCCSDSSP